MILSPSAGPVARRRKKTIEYSGFVRAAFPSAAGFQKHQKTIRKINDSEPLRGAGRSATKKYY